MVRDSFESKQYTTSAAASGWVGGQVTIGNRRIEIISIEINVPSSVNYALPCYLEWSYHEGKQDERVFQLGHGLVQYRKPFVIRGPISLEGDGMILSAVYHHSTSHSHEVKAYYKVINNEFR